MRQKKGQNSRRVHLKTGTRRGKNTRKKRKQPRQRAGFLNSYDFAYTGRDVVNQVGKIAPALMNQAIRQIDKIAQERINQVIRSGRAEVKRVLPKIISWAIEYVCKSPFRLLGNLGKQQFQKIKKKMLRR